MHLKGGFYFQLLAYCTDEPSLSWTEPETWKPGMEAAFPVEGAHETFTSPPGGTVLGAKSPGDPFMVQPVAPTAVPPEFTSDMTHVAVSELHTILLRVTCAGGP